jgi:hypothetical protein
MAWRQKAPKTLLPDSAGWTEKADCLRDGFWSTVNPEGKMMRQKGDSKPQIAEQTVRDIDLSSLRSDTGLSESVLILSSYFRFEYRRWQMAQ